MRKDKLQLQTQVSWCIFIFQQAPGVHYLCSTGLAVTWELSLLGPLRPGLLLCTGWPVLFDGLSPGARSSELREGPHPAPLTPESKPSYLLTLLSPLVMGTDMSNVSIMVINRKTASSSLERLLQVEARGRDCCTPFIFTLRIHMKNSQVTLLDIS